jgi:hypothetical protein
MPKRIAVAALAAALLAVAAKPSGATGRVVDSTGRAIVDAEVCLVVAGGLPGLGARSQADGSYSLPWGEGASAVRIVVRGYLPRTVAAVAQESPVVLEQAAALRVRVVDRGTGKAAASAEIDIVYSTGRKLGPFPANAAGLSLPTLPVGDARVVVRTPDHREATSGVVRLEAGREAEAVVNRRKRSRS